SYDGGIGTDSLILNGTAGADSVSVFSGTVAFGGNTTFTATTEAIAINTLAGNDSITVSTLGSGNPVTVDGGANDDTIIVGNGNLDSTGSSVSVTGSSGTDSLTVNDNTAGFGDSYTLNANSLTRNFFGGVTWGAVESMT